MQVKHLDYLIKFLIRIFFSRAYYFNTINRIWGITKVQYTDKGINSILKTIQNSCSGITMFADNLILASIIPICLLLPHNLRLKLKPTISHCELGKSVYNKCLYVHV